MLMLFSLVARDVFFHDTWSSVQMAKSWLYGAFGTFSDLSSFSRF